MREARAGDRDAIERVTLAAHQQYASLMPALWDGYRENILSTLAAVRPEAQILAEEDERVIGSVLLYPAGTVVARSGGASITLAWPEVRLLAVAPEARGRGVGVALMQECIRRARHAGAWALTLHATEQASPTVAGDQVRYRTRCLPRGDAGDMVLGRDRDGAWKVLCFGSCPA